MDFIENGASGKAGFWSYLGTFLLTVSSVFGVGGIPYSIALVKAGFDINQPIDQTQIIKVLGENSFLFYQLFPFVTGFCVLLLCVRFVHQRPILSIFTIRETFDWRRFFTSFFSWGILLFILFGIRYLINPEGFKWNFNASTFFQLLVISIAIVPIQTSFEELFFRGFLFQGIGLIFKKGWITVLFTGSIFGLMHISNPEVAALGYGVLIYYILSGIFLSLLTSFDQGLELALGFHAINNIFGVLFVTNSWQVFQTDALWVDTEKPTFGWDTGITLFVCYPILLYFFAKIYRWKNWKSFLLNPKTRNSND